MNEIKKVSGISEQVSNEVETLKRLVKFEESLGYSPQNHHMKVILNSKPLRVELFNRM